MLKSVILEFKTAGVRFYQYKSAGVEVGNSLKLIAEPENEYDSNAIKVLKDDIQIGHVPRDMTQHLHPYLNDIELEAIVSYTDFTGKYPIIVVTVIR